ncbi:MAG: hypothetical protein OHK0017_00770 [Patescibacteria group bacterium]
MFGKTVKSLGLSLLFKGSSLIFSVLIVRWYVANFSPSDLEILNLQSSFITTLMVMVTFAIPNLIQRYYIHFEERTKKEVADYWTTMLLLRVGTFILGLILLFIFLPISGTTNLYSALGLYLMQFLLLVDLNFRMISDSLNQSWKFSATDLLNKFLLFAGLYSLPLFEKNLNSILNISGSSLYFAYYLALAILSVLISFVLDWIINLKHIGIGEFHPGLIRKELKSIATISLTTIIIALYSQTDKLFMKYFGLGSEQINGYSIAYRLFESLIIIPALTIPTLATLLHKNRKSDPSKAVKLRIAIIGLALFSTLLAMLVKPVLLAVVDSEGKYTEFSSTSYNLLAIGLIPLTISAYYANKFVFNHKEKYDLIANIITLVFALIGYAVFIPMYGASGAAMVTSGYLFLDLFVKLFLDRRGKI